jgi:hypothetical protein
LKPGGLGRRPSPDERDALFPLRAVMAPVPMIRPPRRRWSDPWVGNQGQTSECVGFGSRGLLVASPVCYRKLTAEDIYQGAEANDGFTDPPGPDRGSSVRGAMKFLVSKGLVAEYRWANRVKDVLDWLGGHGPVVLGTDWHTAMFTPDTSAIVKPKGIVEGGHCYLAIGYDDAPERSGKKPLVECVNSWGRKWGEGGHFYIGYDDLDRLLRANGAEAAAATEQKFGPIVKPIPIATAPNAPKSGECAT